jgi:hypothetical protein
MGRAGVARAREFDVSVLGEKLSRLIAACLQER